MRKILSEEEKQKKNKRNRTIIGVIIIVLLVFSTIGYAFYRTDNTEEKNKIKYKDFNFILEGDGMWHVQSGNFELVTQFNAEETKNISTPTLSLSQYTNKPLYFVSENSVAVNEIARNLNGFILRTQYACLENNCGENLPLKNCTDNLIVIGEKNYTKITKEENCVFINAPYSEAVRASDAFIFQVFGIK